MSNRVRTAASQLMVMNCFLGRSGQALPTVSVRLTLQLPALQHPLLSTQSTLLDPRTHTRQCLSSVSPLAPPAHPHSPVSRSHRASSVSTRPELSASPASSVPTLTHTTLTTRRASRSSPPGESLKYPQHPPYSLLPAATRPPETANCFRPSTLTHTSTRLSSCQLLTVIFQSRYEKEFEGVQDVFELQVLSHC